MGSLDLSLTADWRRHRGLALCWRRRILGWLPRIIWIIWWRGLIIPWQWRLVVIWRRRPAGSRVVIWRWGLVVVWHRRLVIIYRWRLVVIFRGWVAVSCWRRLVVIWRWGLVVVWHRRLVIIYPWRLVVIFRGWVAVSCWRWLVVIFRGWVAVSCWRWLVVICRWILVVICHWRLVIMYLLGGRHVRLVRCLLSHDSPRGAIAVTWATCTTTASHDGKNNCEKHDRADHSAGNAGSSPSPTVWRAVSVITALFSRAAIEIDGAEKTGFSAHTIRTAGLVVKTFTVITTDCSTSRGKETENDNAYCSFERH